MNKGTLIPVKNSDILEKNLGEEIVIMTMKGEVIHTIEGSAIFIWNHIDGSQSIDSIAARITEEYDTEIFTARADLETFLEELQNLELISVN